MNSIDLILSRPTQIIIVGLLVVSALAVSFSVIMVPDLTGKLAGFNMVFSLLIWFGWPSAVVLLLFQHNQIGAQFYAHAILFAGFVISLALVMLLGANEVDASVPATILALSMFGLMVSSVVAINGSGLLAHWPASWFLITICLLYLIIGIFFLAPAMKRGLTKSATRQP